MDSVRRQVKEYRRKLLEEKAAREALISMRTDFNMLEGMIQRVNENPDLRIDITLKDGTIIRLKTYREARDIDPFAADYVEEIK